MLVVVLGLVITGAGYCSDRVVEMVSLRIKGGGFSINASNINFPQLDLRSGDNEVTTENFLTVMDSTGTGSGWSVAARTEDFISTGGKRLNLSKVQFQVEDITPDRVSRINSDEDSGPRGMGMAVKLTGTDQKILTAAQNEGMGRYNIRPKYSISVPPGNRDRRLYNQSSLYSFPRTLIGFV